MTWVQWLNRTKYNRNFRGMNLDCDWDKLDIGSRKAPLLWRQAQYTFWRSSMINKSFWIFLLPVCLVKFKKIVLDPRAVQKNLEKEEEDKKCDEAARSVLRRNRWGVPTKWWLSAEEAVAFLSSNEAVNEVSAFMDSLGIDELDDFANGLEGDPQGQTYKDLVAYKKSLPSGRGLWGH